MTGENLEANPAYQAATLRLWGAVEGVASLALSAAATFVGVETYRHSSELLSEVTPGNTSPMAAAVIGTVVLAAGAVGASAAALRNYRRSGQLEGPRIP